MSVETINDESFDTIISNNALVLVDFWAEWCGPCKDMAPHLEAFANEANGTIKVVKINVDENPMAASKYGIRGLPTLILFKDGDMVQAQAGAVSKGRIAEWVKENS